MNYIDLILFLILLLALWSGWNKGFLVGTFDLLSWIGSIIIAFLAYQSVATYIDSHFTSFGVWTTPLAFIALVIFSRIILSAIFYKLIPASREVHEHKANRFLGLIPGFISGLINASIIAALLLAVPISNSISSTTRESQTAQLLAPKVEWLDDKLSPVFDEAIKKSINNMVVDTASKKTVHLKFKVNSAKPRADLETRMIALVNEERSKQGLKALSYDPELTKVARLHSVDMFAKGYFSHYSLEGSTVADRLKQAGVRYLVAGENLALAQTLTIAHNGLMESPGHRANILQPRYGRVGIGVMDGGVYGLMITQVFKN